MKILMALSQKELTGAEVYSAKIADYLISKGHEVFIVSDTLNIQTKAKYIPIPLTKRTIFYRIKNILSVCKVIKSNQIDVIHCHSRATAWIAFFAGFFTRTPYVVTIHGRQSTFKSRKLLKCLGNYTITVCEELKKQLIEVIGTKSSDIEVLRNGFEFSQFDSIKWNPSEKETVITLVTRLTGPKGELAFKILERLIDELAGKNIKIKVVGGREIPSIFEPLQKNVEFAGFINDPKLVMSRSNLIIAGGRSAIEGLLLGVPTIAAGEAEIIGLIDENNISRALATNFGDMAEIEKNFNFDLLIEEVHKGLQVAGVESMVIEKIKNEFDLTLIGRRLENIYRSVYVNYHENEIPVIMYHRVIKNASDAGVHGTYVTVSQFEEHLKILKRKKYQSISYEEVLEKKLVQGKNKYVIITFDDGYNDNYSNALPLLKKYGFIGYIFCVSGLKANVWDADIERKEFLLMNDEELKFIASQGIIIGGHTCTHADLTLLIGNQLETEIKKNQVELEEKIGMPVNSFAYPYGRFNIEVINSVQKAGYNYAFATDSGPIPIHENPFVIRRIAIFPNTNNLGFARKIKGSYIFNKMKNNKK